MARATQIRLTQITGSLIDKQGGIVDNLGEDSAATIQAMSITSGSLVGVLSEMASAIKRINGGTTFAGQAAGVFKQALLPAADDSYDLGSLASAWQDLFLEGDITLTDAGQMATSAGALTLDGKAGVSIKEDGASIITVNDARNIVVENAAAIDIDGSGALSIDSSAGSITMGAILANGQTLTLGPASATQLVLTPHGTAGSEKISLVNTSGTAADAVKIHADAGGLQLLADSTTHGVKIGTGTSGVPVTIGHGTSEVTVSDNLTVTGDLTVNGATVTIDTTNLIVEDSLILLGTGSSGNNQNGGIAIHSGSSAGNDLVFGRIANDTWGVGKVDTKNGAITNGDVSGMQVVNLRAAKFEVGTNVNDNIEVDSSNLGISAAAELELKATTILNIDADQGQVKLSDGGTLIGEIAMHGSDLYLSSSVSNKDMIFMVNDGGAMTEVMRLDGDVSALKVASGKEVQFGSANETISGDGTDLSIASNGNINVTSTVNEEASIYLRANAGANETVRIHSDQGTGVNAKGGSTDASINLISDVGGIGLYSGINADNAITLEANGGVNETIQIRSNQGTGKGAVALANTVNASIALVSDVGGVCLASGLNSTEAILLEADGGTSETIQIHSNQGTSLSSILLKSDVGGITFAAGLDNASCIELDATNAGASGGGITLTVGDQNDSVLINNGPLQFESISAPSTTTRKLYTVGTTLYFDGSPLSISSDRAILKVGATITSGTKVETNGTTSNTSALLSTNGIDFSGLSNEIIGAQVFVNGQLLLSGTDTNVGTGAADYTVVHTGSVKFGFSLETDDIIQVIS